MRKLNAQIQYLRAQQASAWLEVMAAASAGQRAEFVAWLKESPEHVREVLLLLAVDRALGEIDANRIPGVQELLAQTHHQVVALRAWPATPAPVVAAQRRRRWIGVAAGVAALAAAGWFLFSPGAAGWQEYRTAKSEQRAFELADGSLIDLNTDSRVAVRFSPQSRDVRLLEGEAFFRVRHNAGRPFRVYTKDVVIQDVGTEFNVYNHPDYTVIAVIEGSVTVAPARPAAVAPSAGAAAALGAAGPAITRTLTAHEEAHVSRAGSVKVRQMPEVADAVAWQQRRLVFRQQPLQAIVEEFNRYSRKKIRLEGPAVVDHVFTGVFDADDPDSLMQVLGREADLAVDASADDIVIRSR
jgi:transmembrane sensor